MKKQKLFGSFAIGSSRIPLHSNVFNTGRGYSPIGGSNSRLFEIDRKSPLLGNAMASNRLSSYYEKMSEIKGYQLLDISKLATNFFADYVTNFLSDSNASANNQVVTIVNEDGSTNEQASQRLNDILLKDIKIFDFIRNHVQDYIYYGGYFSMLTKATDETGHTKFRVEELNDPVTVVAKKKRNPKTDEIEEVFLAKGDDGVLYEIPENEIIYLATNNLRLINDLREDWKDKQKQEHEKPKEGKGNNRDKVLKKESYLTSEPLFYSLTLKVKELVIKELLVSLISLRDLSSVQIFLLQFDKSVPLEAASDLCARTTKLANNTNEIASFLSSQFDVVSFIENTLTQSAKFVPDYNSTVGNKNSMLPLDKLSDKMLDMLQTISTCKDNILSPLGLPSTISDSTSGTKWQVLQQSERANSRVFSYVSGIRSSVTDLVCALYYNIYNEKLSPSQVKLRVCEKTSVEYNNQISQSESIGGLISAISNILQGALQTIEITSPLIDPQAFVNYVHNLIKDIDAGAENLINEDTLNMYLQLVQGKINQNFEQLGIDPSTIQPPQEPTQNV